MKPEFDNIIAFIRDHYSTKEFIPLHEPRFIGKEKEFVLDAIDSTFVSSVGEYVDKFESMISNLTQAKKGVAIVNGTSALQVALRLAGVSSGDEVLTQALTFIATTNAIAYNGASPVFLDVDLDTMGLSPISVEDFLNSYGEIRENGCYNKQTGRKISACLPMHTFGFPVKFDELKEICKKWHIPVIEDAAESLGSEYKGKPTGALGELGILSFNGNKIVTAGGGGAIVTNNVELGTLAKHLTTTAKKPHRYEYAHDYLGYNFRMPNLNAALICAQLENLNVFIQNKRELASKYSAIFESLSMNFRLENEDTKANYWLMCIELEDKAQRDLFLDYSNNSGIMTRPIWQLVFKSEMYKNCYRDDQVNARYLEDRIVNIPSSVRL